MGEFPRTVVPPSMFGWLLGGKAEVMTELLTSTLSMYWKMHPHKQARRYHDGRWGVVLRFPHSDQVIGRVSLEGSGSPCNCLQKLTYNGASEISVLQCEKALTAFRI